jgi:hypothetical protein
MKKGTLTPKERNRIRQIRDLLDLYERMESSRPNVVLNLARAVGELSDAHTTAVSDKAAETLKRLKR